MPSLSRHFLLFNIASNLLFSLSPLTSTLTKNASVSPLTSTLTKTKDLKSFIINTYKKGVGVPLPLDAPACPNRSSTGGGAASTWALDWGINGEERIGGQYAGRASQRDAAGGFASG